MGGKINYVHIKGHQDKLNNKLSFEAQLNILADELANEGMKLGLPDHYKLPSTKAMLFMDNLAVCKEHKKVLKESYHSMDMRKYYQEKYDWKDKTTDNIW
jgi:hypothetical protein